MGGGQRVDVVQPHRHSARLGTFTNAEHADATAAIEAAIAAKAGWEATPFDERAAVFLRAADLLAGPWREKIAAATMLGQSKTAYQAEIDTPCELDRLLAVQRRVRPADPGAAADQQPRRVEPHRLPSAGGLRLRDHAVQLHRDRGQPADRARADGQHGGVEAVADTDLLAAYLTMQLLEAAGLPPGVINLLTGDGIAVSDVALADPRLAGIHFTGSTGTFQHLWREVGTNIDRYHTYPRLVGETGGKDFVVAHASARPDVLRTALIRGAFDYQGQKCSAASRAFVPRSVWQQMGDDFLVGHRGVALRRRHRPDQLRRRGDRRAGVRQERQGHRAGQERGQRDDRRRRRIRRQRRVFRPSDRAAVRRPDRRGVLARSTSGRSCRCTCTPTTSTTDILDVVDKGAKYALTGAVIADDRSAVLAAEQRLRHAAGNFYVNDKPTGAVVGQQPFGGSRASGTNDKAGSALNLLRWTSARSIKETFVPPTDHDYPHMEAA